MEKLNINRDGVKISSVDTVNMYPSIKFATNQKIGDIFSRKLTATTKNTINICLELIRFAMNSILIYFDGD